jgi:hypothetical protein
LLCAFVLLLSSAALAAEVEGIPLPERVRMGADGPELVLNGAGLRQRIIFNIYVAALYLPVKSADGETILRKDQPRRLLLHFLRNLTAKEMTDSTNDALRETLTPEERKPLEMRMLQFNSIFATLREITDGMELVIDYIPRLGTIVRVDGKSQEVIAGADFNRALLRMWLGDRPRDLDLKKALLGSGLQPK